MTVTTTTTTVVLVTTMEAALTIGVIGTIVLIMALIVRELAVAYGDRTELLLEVGCVVDQGERVRHLGRNVLVAVLPLLLVFIFAVVIRVSEVLTQ